MAYDLDKMKNDYEFFLRKLIIQAKEVDVKVVLVSQIANMLILPSNLITTETDSGIKPVKSINDELNGERDILLKTSNEELQNLLSLNKLDELRKYIDKLLEQDNKDPVAYYYLGLSYLAEENNKLARKNFLLAQEYDRMPFRFRPSYIGVLSRLAKNHENTYFVNLDENIEYLIPDGIADGRIVMDTMHPTIELNKFIANEIVEKFFIKNLIRDDLFDYKMFSSKSLYGPFSDANKYGLICKRFYQLENWEECIKLARSEYEASSGLGNLANRRRQSRLWESIYYNGVSNKIDKRQESRKIAPMPSNEI